VTDGTAVDLGGTSDNSIACGRFRGGGGVPSLISTIAPTAPPNSAATTIAETTAGPRRPLGVGNETIRAVWNGLRWLMTCL